MFVQPLQTRGQIYVITESGVVVPVLTAEIADVRLAGVQADPRGKQTPMNRLCGPFAEEQRRMAGKQSMVPVSVGRVPESKHGVTDEFGNSSLGRMDALRNGNLKVLVHHAGEFMRIDPFGNGGEIGDVAEQKRERLIFPAVL